MSLMMPPLAESAADPAAGAVVLVVDDDVANRESLTRRLQRRGCTVIAAADGAEALRHFAAASLDLVLLDVMMPGISGLEVLETIRRTHSHTMLPIIMATAKDASEDIVRAFDLGANDYVTKPLDFAVVMARVRTHLQLKRSVEHVLDLEHRLAKRNHELEAAAARLRRDLETAARVQAALLPVSPPAVDGFHFAWAFHPCDQLAGDSFNAFAFDEQQAGLYVLDVSGHGVAAALLAVAATRLLSPGGEADSILLRATDVGLRSAGPAEVAQRLNQKLPWHPTAQQFLTLFYAVVDGPSRTFTYTSAGHPGAIRISRDTPPETLNGSGLPIGISGDGEETYEQTSLQLSPGDRVYLYSDGVSEAMSPDEHLFGADRLLAAIAKGATLGLQESIALILNELDAWRGGAASRDDVTLLALECAPL